MLPAGWEQMTDPESGMPYYTNRLPETTQWDPPATVGLPSMHLCHSCSCSLLLRFPCLLSRALFLTYLLQWQASAETWNQAPAGAECEA